MLDNRMSIRNPGFYPNIIARIPEVRSILSVITNLFDIGFEDITEKVAIDGNRVYAPGAQIVFVDDVKINDVSIGGWFLKDGVIYLPRPVSDDENITIHGIIIDEIRRAYILRNKKGFGPVVY